MTQALKNAPVEEFPVPDGVVFVRVDRETGQLLPAGSGGFFEAFKAGTEPVALATDAPGAKPARADVFLEERPSPLAPPAPMIPAFGRRPPVGRACGEWSSP